MGAGGGQGGTAELRVAKGIQRELRVARGKQQELSVVGGSSRSWRWPGGHSGTWAEAGIRSTDGEAWTRHIPGSRRGEKEIS